jgi:hypothetical protein
MFNRIHQKLGTAGFIISIVALVAALGGGAYAASGALTGKQKKEVEKIAKKYAGKPGAPGAAGTSGTNGTNGKDGTNGKGGEPGKSVTVSATSACAEGGITVKVEGAASGQEVCNGEEGEPGEEGSPWVAGGVLPPEQTETGSWTSSVFAESETYVPISFTLPLPSDLDGSHVLYVPGTGTVPAQCDDGVVPNASAAHPEADPGYLCVFRAGPRQEIGGENIWKAANSSEHGASTAGAILELFNESSDNHANGTWAVRAEAP